MRDWWKISWKFDDFYQARGMKVTHIHADGQFKTIKSTTAKSSHHKISMEIEARNVHVKRAERMIRLIKERVRGVRSMLPFEFFPKRLTIEMIYAIISNINAIPRKHTIHYGRLSVCEILTGKALVTPKACIGSFVHAVPTDNNTKNNPNIVRTFDALYLKPKNDGPGYWVLKIETMQPLQVHRVITAPISDSVIKLVNQAGKREGNPKGFFFADKNNMQKLEDFEPVEHLDDNASDSTYESKDDSKIDNDHGEIEDDYAETKQ